MKNKGTIQLLVITILFPAWFIQPTFAVTSEINRFSSAADLLKGEVRDTVINSEGIIFLKRQVSEIDCGSLLDNIWSINALAADDKGNVYMGTSPNGDIIRISNGKSDIIYTAVTDQDRGQDIFKNEHVFALGIDKAGRLLAGISGENCRLIRYNGKIETLYSPENARYILSIALDELGNIFIGTGPEGNIYKTDPFGNNPQLIYTANDNNVLSLAASKDGCLYAGCDERGLVYKIDPATGNTTVVFDSEQVEITSLVLDKENNLYAAATNAQAVKEKVNFDPIASDTGSGKTETEDENAPDDKTSTELNIANTETGKSAPKGPAPVKRGALPKTAGHIYKINPEGFVTDIFSDMSVFFDMKLKDNNLLLGTGNESQLYSVDIETETKEVTYEDTESSQVTTLAVVGENFYIGCANPPKLLKVSDSYVTSGTYTSELIDASQPAKWGKLQIEADLPDKCRIYLSARSGNVNDPNDSTFSSWSPEVSIKDATQIDCPTGRFCQYRLTLKTDDISASPKIKEIAAAYIIPNLPPKISSVKINPVKSKPGIVQIVYVCTDKNKDTLVYRIEFRKAGRNSWIELKDEHTAPNLEWDTKTVEDGRYEIRVVADDARSNTTETALTSVRISDPVIVDNTAPAIKNPQLSTKGNAATLSFELEDEYSAIESVNYTVDSNDKWTGTLPVDLVYDTTGESFTITVKELDQGSHVISLKFSDHAGNTAYKSFDLNI